MDDIGEILFYIVAAIIGLVTTLGKKKKKPNMAVPVPPDASIDYNETEDNEPVYVEAIPRDDYSPADFPDNDYENELQRAAGKNTGEQESFMPSVDGEYIESMAVPFISEGEIGQDNSFDEDSSEDLVSLITTEDEFSDLATDFDLREAIIYSEVLNRKYY